MFEWMGRLVNSAPAPPPRPLRISQPFRELGLTGEYVTFSPGFTQSENLLDLLFGLPLLKQEVIHASLVHYRILE